MKKKLLAMICLVATLLSSLAVGIIPASAADGDWIDREHVTDVDYSFAVLGDIQNTTYDAAKNYTLNLDKMFTWILKNKETQNIQYVFGLGDSVETLTTYPQAQLNPKEWDTVFNQFSRLNGKIPYGVVRGNHDDEAGYHEHICTPVYQNQMEEFFFDPTKPVTLGNSMSNSYQKIQIGNHKYLMLNLDFRATPEVIAWADEVIYKNSDYKVIISTHAYMSGSGTFLKCNIGSSNVDDTVLEQVAFDGQVLWDNLFSQHENVFMILCGHVAVSDPVIHTRTGKKGNEVIEILVDPQGYEANDPCGTLMMLNFTEGGQKIEVEYFSPSKDKFFREKNQRTIVLDEGVLPTYIPTSASQETESITSPTDTAEATTESSSEDLPNGEKNSLGVIIGVGVGLGCVVLGGVSFVLWKVKKKK